MADKRIFPRGKPQRPGGRDQERGPGRGADARKGSGKAPDRERDRNNRNDRPQGDRGRNPDRSHDRPRTEHPRAERPRNERPRGEGRPRSRSAPGFNASLWGTHAVREAWLNPQRRIHALYITENALASFKDELEGGRRLGRPAPVTVDKYDLDKALPPGAVHQGLALDAEELDEVFVQDLIARAAAKGRSLLVMLDQVTDPHNVGAILRSACAFGADGMILQRRHAPELSGVLAKTACGAAEHMPVAYETNLSRTLELLKEAGFFVLGLDERGEKTFGELPVYEKAVLVLGAEGPGMRQLIREKSDILVRLPTSGAIASLNVSNAAAVSLFAMVARQGRP